jgi:hypothetical protein
MGVLDMANLDLFDKAGRFTQPSPETLAALSDPERAAIARIRDASNVLDAANLAAQENADALKSTQTEIAALEKVIPKITFNDLIKAQCRDTAARRAGI